MKTEESGILESTSVCTSNYTIEELYDNTMKLCKKKHLLFLDNWKITYSHRPNHHIVMEGIPYSFIVPRGQLGGKSIWDVRFVQKSDFVEVTLSLLVSPYLSWSLMHEESMSKYLFLQVASYLFENIGIDVEDDEI